MAQPATRPVSAPFPLRALAAAALLAVLLGAALGAWFTSEHATRVPVVARQRPHVLALSAQLPISAALGRDGASYRVHELHDGVALARNRAQHLSALFASSGVRLRSNAMTVGLRLRQVGYGDSLRSVDTVPPRVSSNRVEYAHSLLSEWYVNGPLGLEQGFNVARAPATRPSGPLTLSLSVSGGAHVSLTAGGTRVALTGGNRSSLDYGQLAASDARGRTLPTSMALARGRILLHVDVRGARFPVRIDPLVRDGGKLTASDESGELGSLFGFSVALSGDGNTALIGGPRDKDFAGAAWVFTRSGGEWSEAAKLTGGEPAGSAQCSEEPGIEAEPCSFGRSVALSADGATAMVGSPHETRPCRLGSTHTCPFQGGAWVFTRSESGWSLQDTLTGSGEETPEGHFGRGVALSADGSTAVVGGSNDGDGKGAVWFFTRSGSTWEQQGSKLTASDELGLGHIGASIGLSADGNTAFVGGPGDNSFVGAAWVFTRSGSSWQQFGSKLTAGAEELEASHFGSSVALSADATTALVGARADAKHLGAAWAFAPSGSTWVPQSTKLTAGAAEIGAGEFGSSVALSGDGNLALIGAPRDNARSGAAWEYTREGGVWTQGVEKLTGTAEIGSGFFGTSVAISPTGVGALIGGPRDNSLLGAVWPYLVPPPPSPPPPPAVERITPSGGPTAGGTDVTIRGSGFVAGASVTIGSAATAVNVVSETEITARTAPTAAGSQEVVVTDERGTSTGGPLFTYRVPTPPRRPPPSPQPNVQQSVASAGSLTPSQGILSMIAVALPPPVLGVSSNVTPLAGVVRVKLPGSSTFVLLTTARQLPFGTIIDARHGKVSITTVGPHGRLQTLVLYEGEFKLTQARNALVTAALYGGNFSVCPTARERSHIARAITSRASRKHAVRKLWAEGHGSYSTKGNYAAGAVLGTKWLTVDECGGTLIRVSTDRVAVTNLVNHKRVIVKARHSYLAKAP